MKTSRKAKPAATPKPKPSLKAVICADLARQAERALCEWRELGDPRYLVVAMAAIVMVAGFHDLVNEDLVETILAKGQWNISAAEADIILDQLREKEHANRP